MPSPLPSLPYRAANLHSQGAVHDLHDDPRNSDVPCAVHNLHDDDRDAHPQSAVHGLLDPTGMPYSQGAVCDLLVDGEVLHQESAVHDLHDDHPNLHSQSAVHNLQASAIHPHGDSHSLRAPPSAGQAKLLRATSGLPPSTIHGLHSGLPAADVPDLHRRPTWPKLLEQCDEIIRRMGTLARLLDENRKVGEVSSPAFFRFDSTPRIRRPSAASLLSDPP